MNDNKLTTQDANKWKKIRDDFRFIKDNYLKEVKECEVIRVDFRAKCVILDEQKQAA